MGVSSLREANAGECGTSTAFALRGKDIDEQARLLTVREAVNAGV